MHEDAKNLIPELSRWNDGAGIDLETWVACLGRFDHAICYAAIFWPDFVVHDDCILFDPVDVENFNDWMTHCKGNRTAVESVVNHRHIVDLFDNKFEPTKEVVRHIGRLLKDMWSCKLARDFPGRSVKVEISEPQDSEDLYEYQITVFQERK